MGKPAENEIRIAIDLPLDIAKELNVIAALNDTSRKQLIEHLAIECAQRNKKKK